MMRAMSPPWILMALATLLIIGCAGPGAPTPTPGGMAEVLPALALRGATVHEVVSGDAGCPGSTLRSNVARLDVSVAGAEARYAVYLFRWRRAADFAAAAGAFSDCVDEFVAEADGEVTIDGVEIAPWRAYGPGWSEELRLLIEEALSDLAGG
jgi:hypothetical protein